MPSLQAFELAASQIPATYTPALLTVTGTLLAAAFTSVIAQYFFTPVLEARKQRLLDRSRAATATVEKLREMQFWLEAMQSRLRMRDSFGHEKQREQFDERAVEFDALLSLAHAGLSQKYTTLAFRTQLIAEVYALIYDPAEQEIDTMVELLSHTIGALDPVNLPWSRAKHCARGRRTADKFEQSDAWRINA